MGACNKELAGKANKAVSMIRRVMWKLGVFEHKALFKIFDSLVVPILCYGSEGWDTNIRRKLSKYTSTFANQSWELESMPQTQPYLVNVADANSYKLLYKIHQVLAKDSQKGSQLILKAVL